MITNPACLAIHRIAIEEYWIIENVEKIRSLMAHIKPASVANPQGMKKF